MQPEDIIQARIAQAQRGPKSTPYDLLIPFLIVVLLLTHSLVPALALMNALAPIAGLLAALFIADDGEMPARLPIPA